MNLLDGLSKEDLIAVIANITYLMGAHDFRDYGLTVKDTEIAVKICSECKEYCIQNGWDMPQV